MNDGREHAPAYERKVLGMHEMITLPVESYVRLPQVRSGLNPILPDLIRSIRNRGLDNPLDVARMTHEQLEAYIAFVNHTWKTAVSIDDYAMQQQPDGMYYLVVAGHTRTEAIFQLQAEHPVGYDVVAKVHPISTPEEIIGLQLDENIHSQPAQEQRAIAIVETFRYGLESGMWTNKADFLRQSKGKCSRRVLDEAMGFAQLPPEAVDFVFSGQVSYNAGVALGLATDTVMDHVAFKLGYNDDLPSTAPQEFDEAYRKEISLILAYITNRGLNGPAAKKYISGQVAQMKQQMEKSRQDKENPQEDMFDFAMVSPREQAEAYKRQLQKEYEAALREMKERSIDSVTTALRLHRRLVGEKESDELQNEHESRRRQLGGRALHSIPSPRAAEHAELVAV